jgi:hypothetical protein
VLTDRRPDVAVMHAGSASTDVGRPILMPIDELLEFVRLAPGLVVANHLEALNHCPTTRAQLSAELAKAGLRDRVLIPNDGETIELGDYVAPARLTGVESVTDDTRDRLRVRRRQTWASRLSRSLSRVMGSLASLQRFCS